MQTMKSSIQRITEKPLAAPGLKSYRCETPFGWIMIGATDDQDALKQAKRSSNDAKKEVLQMWNGKEYVAVTPASIQ